MAICLMLRNVFGYKRHPQKALYPNLGGGIEFIRLSPWLRALLTQGGQGPGLSFQSPSKLLLELGLAGELLLLLLSRTLVAGFRDATC